MEYSYEILNDRKLREIIVKLLGTNNFKEFRWDLNISVPLRRFEDSFVVGSGCKPHACGGSGPASMFVLDVKNNLAWAVHSDDIYDDKLRERPPSARLWGVLTASDVIPLREIKHWLAQKGIPEGSVSVVSLPNNIAELYKQPRKAAATLATGNSSSTSTTEDKSKKEAYLHDQGSEKKVIHLKREGGTFVVPVSINDTITLSFTLDSGAADVSIPADVVMTLFRTGTLSREDFLGKQTYRLADGSTIPSQTFRIRSLKVGDHVIENVTGSIASVSGGLLLGQSFLSRFKSGSVLI